MLAKVFTAACLGLDCVKVSVEAHIGRALPKFIIVGLADTAVQEARERVIAACDNSGFTFPRTKVTVNLAPADVRKEGTSFDLPLALAVLAERRIIPSASITSDALFIGELGLDGSVRPVRSVINMTAFARQAKFKQIYVPKANVSEAALIADIQVYPVSTLQQLVAHLTGGKKIIRAKNTVRLLFNEQKQFRYDFVDIRGQAQAKRALELAAAGGHNVLFIGPPGAGKTLLAQALISILPPLDIEEALSLSKIYSYAGLLPADTPLMRQRPFRAPHHSASQVSLVGGGSWPKPGEITLAHRGVLFLDELPEFPRQVLDALRQPLEEHVVTISRAQANVTYPAEFILIAACNPCPCGYNGYRQRPCVCRPNQIQQYQRKLSGPLLDRIDIYLNIVPVDSQILLTANQSAESSGVVRDRVLRARQLQSERQGILNSLLLAKQLEAVAPLDSQSRVILEQASTNLALSSRAIHKVIKLGRTIADIEGTADIRTDHILEALQYRRLQN